MPPPWRLRGRGYVVVYRRPRACACGDAAGRGTGALAALLLLSYHSSPAGPYGEAILACGPLRDPDGLRPRLRWTVRRIWVTTAVSLANGRRNWGLPKQEAHIDFDGGSRPARRTEAGATGRRGAAPARTETVVARLPAGARPPGSRRILEADLRPWGPHLPVPHCLTLRLLQSLGGRSYRTDITGGGRVRPARLERLVVGSPHLPAFLNHARPLLVLAVEELGVIFPPARVLPSERRPERRRS